MPAKISPSSHTYIRTLATLRRDGSSQKVNLHSDQRHPGNGRHTTEDQRDNATRSEPSITQSATFPQTARKSTRLPRRQWRNSLILAIEIKQIDRVARRIPRIRHARRPARRQVVRRQRERLLQRQRGLDHRGDEARVEMPVDVAVEEPDPYGRGQFFAV